MVRQLVIKMSVQQTSLDAYHSIKETLNKREEEVYLALVSLGKATNKELAVELGLAINQVTGRTFSLREKGLVKEVGKKNQENNREAIVWAPGEDKNKIKQCLSNVELKNVFYKISRANKNQLDKIKEFTETCILLVEE